MSTFARLWNYGTLNVDFFGWRYWIKNASVLEAWIVFLKFLVNNFLSMTHVFKCVIFDYLKGNLQTRINMSRNTLGCSGEFVVENINSFTTPRKQRDFIYNIKESGGIMLFIICSCLFFIIYRIPCRLKSYL